jgi:hypothetical protein
MKTQMKLLGMIVISFALLIGSRRAQQTSDSSCALVQQALTDYQRLRVGNTRAAVERYFQQDGGAQFPGNTRYVFPKCQYLHVEIEFELKGSAGQLFSSDDIVTKISKLYVDYQAKD